MRHPASTPPSRKRLRYVAPVRPPFERDRWEEECDRQIAELDSEPAEDADKEKAHANNFDA